MTMGYYEDPDLMKSLGNLIFFLAKWFNGDTTILLNVLFRIFTPFFEPEFFDNYCEMENIFKTQLDVKNHESLEFLQKLVGIYEDKVIEATPDYESYFQFLIYKAKLFEKMDQKAVMLNNYYKALFIMLANSDPNVALILLKNLKPKHIRYGGAILDNYIKSQIPKKDVSNIILIYNFLSLIKKINNLLTPAESQAEKDMQYIEQLEGYIRQFHKSNFQQILIPKLKEIGKKLDPKLQEMVNNLIVEFDKVSDEGYAVVLRKIMEVIFQENLKEHYLRDGYKIDEQNTNFGSYITQYKKLDKRYATFFNEAIWLKNKIDLYCHEVCRQHDPLAKKFKPDLYSLTDSFIKILLVYIDLVNEPRSIK